MSTPRRRTRPGRPWAVKAWLGVAVLTGSAPARAEGPVVPCVAQESVERLLAAGRRALAEERVDDALGLFVQAHVLSGESQSTHVWLLRAWIAQGRINDTFDVVDRWLTEGRSGAGIDYVLGMAFHARARDHIAADVPMATVRRNFESAAERLTSATEAAPERFDDAWAALAEARWFLQEGRAARSAAERAVTLAPDDAATRFLLAQILFTLYLERQGGESQEGGAQEQAGELWEAARSAYEATLGRLSEPRDNAEERLRARADLALAHLHLWGGEKARALELIADALEHDPAGVDYDGLQELVHQERLAPRELEDALRAGSTAFVERAGRADVRDARLDWWIGYLALERAREGREAQLLLDAESHLLRSVREEPAFLNAWYYAGMAAYLRGDHAAAIEAWRGAWAVEPSNLIGMLSYSQEEDLRVLDWLIGWCAREQRALDAAFLCEVRVELAPRAWEHWNDLGLFARDAGRALAADDAERARAQWERSLAAYARAYELAPDKPHLLNDRAVVLHYDLERELDEARRLYEAARDQARRLLATELAAEDRELAQKALDDATANLAELED